MRNWLIPVLVLGGILHSCVQERKENIVYKQLPKEWISLTKTDSGMIIFNSCDMGNLLLSIVNGNEILLHGTQEDDTLDIIDINIFEEDSILFNVKKKGSNIKEKVMFNWIDKSKGLGNWLIYPGQKPWTFVTTDKSKDFETVNQPCKECWPDTECDLRKKE